MARTTGSRSSTACPGACWSTRSTPSGALLSEFGQELDAVELRTVHGGVFKIYVDGDEIHDGKEEGYDEDAILADIGDRL